jgi:hypothetical protein
MIESKPKVFHTLEKAVASAEIKPDGSFNDEAMPDSQTEYYKLHLTPEQIKEYKQKLANAEAEIGTDGKEKKPGRIERDFAELLDLEEEIPAEFLQKIRSDVSSTPRKVGRLLNNLKHALFSIESMLDGNVIYLKNLNSLLLELGQGEQQRFVESYLNNLKNMNSSEAIPELIELLERIILDTRASYEKIRSAKLAFENESDPEKKAQLGKDFRRLITQTLEFSPHPEV